MQATRIKTRPSAARDRLIDTAERLYAEHGEDGISLRQISAAAGNANNYAVQYHFGSADGLITAIMERRIPVLEAQRDRMLAELEEQGRLSDTRALMNVLYRPLADHRTYARFVRVMGETRAGLRRIGSLNHLLSTSARALRLVYAANPHVPPALVRERMRLIATMYLNSIFNRNPPFEGTDLDETLLDNVLDMATAAVTAPMSDSVAEMMRSTDTE